MQTDWINALYRDADLAELTIRARNGEALTETEEFRLQGLRQRMLVAFEYVYGEVQRGMIDESTMSAEAWQGGFRNVPRMMDTWNQSKSNRDPGFVRWMEANVVN